MKQLVWFDGVEEVSDVGVVTPTDELFSKLARYELRGDSLAVRGLAYKDGAIDIGAVNAFSFGSLESLIPENLAEQVRAQKESKKFVIGKLIGPVELSAQLCADGNSPSTAYFLFTAEHPNELNGLMSKLDDAVIYIGKRMIDAGVDAIRIADDVACHAGLMYNPKMFLPHHKKITDELKQYAKATGKQVELIYHGDGNLSKIEEEIAKMFHGVHPIDYSPDYEETNLTAAKRLSSKGLKIYSGMPIELIYSNDIEEQKKGLEIAKKWARELGPENLVLTTTHRPFATQTPDLRFLREAYDEIKK